MRLPDFVRQVNLWAGIHSRIQRILHHSYKCLSKYQSRTLPPNVLMDIINAVLKIQQKAFTYEPSLEQDYNFSMAIYIDIDTSLSHIHMRLTDLMVVESSTNRFLEYVLPRGVELSVPPPPFSSSGPTLQEPAPKGDV